MNRRKIIMSAIGGVVVTISGCSSTQEEIDCVYNVFAIDDSDSADIDEESVIEMEELTDEDESPELVRELFDVVQSEEPDTHPDDDIEYDYYSVDVESAHQHDMLQDRLQEHERQHYDEIPFDGYFIRSEVHNQLIYTFVICDT